MFPECNIEAPQNFNAFIGIGRHLDEIGPLLQKMTPEQLAAKQAEADARMRANWSVRDASIVPLLLRETGMPACFHPFFELSHFLR